MTPSPAHKHGKVSLVGAGPGDPGLLTLKAARAIGSCDVLVYDYLASEAVVALAAPTCEKIYVGKKAGAHTLSQEEITALIVGLGREGKHVVRLKGGDVFVFARGGEEAAALRAAGIPFEIVPGITSAIAAPAYAGIPVTHREHNTAFTVATGHEDPDKGFSSLDFSKLANPAQTLIFLMAMGNLGEIVSRLLAAGMPADMPTAIVREGTRPGQETLVATLGTIVAEVERTRFAAPAVVVIGNVVRERERIRWFDTHPLFGRRVLLTRPSSRSGDIAGALAEIGAQPVHAPTIAIGPPDDPAAAEHAALGVRAYEWVVFTSRNGVETFFTHLAAHARDARALGGTSVAAIGPKTAQTLAAYGIAADLTPTRFIGEALAEEMIARTSEGTRVLLYRAQEGREALVDQLRKAGRYVDVVAAYKTSLIEDPSLWQRAAGCDIWTFTSASTLHGFLRNVPDAAKLAHGKRIACLGPITARAAEEAGLRVDAVAEEYTVEGMLGGLLLG